VKVAGGQAARTVAPGTSEPGQLFDVLSELRPDEPSTPGTAFQEGIGGDSDCANATKEKPVCGIVILPSGSNSPVLLSLGACDATYAACRSNRGVVVQTLADLSGLYSKAAPATLVIKCDKSLCGTGSIQSKIVSYSAFGNAPLAAAPACPAKGIVGATAACVDYVQSKRDGAGDTHLYLLFAQDMRGGIS
jgi:hypothetical protein